MIYAFLYFVINLSSCACQLRAPQLYNGDVKMIALARVLLFKYRLKNDKIAINYSSNNKILAILY